MDIDELRQKYGLKPKSEIETVERTPDELAKIEKFKKAYMKIVRTPRTAKVYTPIKLDHLKIEFKKVFEEMEGTDLILTNENKKMFDLISRYFAKDKSFNETDLTMNKPSLNKGLLFIGSYGIGKTAMMDTFQEIGRRLMPNNFMWFKSVSTLDVVEEFEASDNQNKESFFKKYNDVRTIYFDDFGTESDASNYGKKNLMKEILEKRYLNKKKTYLTTNLSMMEIKEKYGNRVFSRLPEMFNIIEFKGDDFRMTK